MATNTYVALDKVTVGTATPSITFSSIPSGYTDLQIVVGNFGMNTAGSAMRMRFNGDTASNYSDTFLVGDGSTATSGRESSVTSIRVAGLSVGPATTNTDTVIIQVQNYSNSTTYKTALIRDSSSVNEVGAVVGLWRSTAAISSITLVSYNGTHNILAGSTFSLYGIQAWAPESSPKATGGYVTSDASYWYHTFPFSGTFTPLQTLSCDYLVVAGGGSGGLGTLGDANGGGGGGGGFKTATALSLSTAQTITIGAGGASAANGENTVFGSITSTGGGRGGTADSTGFSGGSGGGASQAGAGARAGGTASPSGQGNDGGGSVASSPFWGGGGGGFGSTGSSNGNGGTATTSSYSGSSQSYAGGGSGGSGGAGSTATAGTNAGTGAIGTVSATNATANFGGGGGGGCSTATKLTAGQGGSGIVIVRYAK